MIFVSGLVSQLEDLFGYQFLYHIYTLILYIQIQIKNSS